MAFELTKLPKKPFKSFESYLHYYTKHSSKHHRTKKVAKYPCPECLGIGQVCRWEDRDVIEGFKLAPRYTCDSCGGSGETTVAYYKTAYKAEMAKYKQAYAKALNRRKAELGAAENARRLLTVEERRLLGLLPEKS